MLALYYEEELTMAEIARVLEPLGVADFATPVARALAPAGLPARDGDEPRGSDEGRVGPRTSIVGAAAPNARPAANGWG